ncbi:MAG: glycosyltransferase family 2 protein [Pseudomonadota bacterium]
MTDNVPAVTVAESIRAFAIIVTLDPDIEMVRAAIACLLRQCAGIVVLNNSRSRLLSELDPKFPPLYVMELGENCGIAAAQNMGIRIAQSSGATHVLLADQDTIFPDDYVRRMVLGLGSDRGTICAVPQYRDRISGRLSHFFPVSGGWVDPLSGFSEMSHAIASGMVIRCNSLAGDLLMNEGLFVYWVDTEWCWRVRQAGFRIIGIPDVEVIHQLGDSAMSIGPLTVTLRTPQSHYYIVRNGIHLALRHPRLGASHRLMLLAKLVGHVLAYPTLARPRISNLRAVSLGLIHGISGRLGRFDL